MHELDDIATNPPWYTRFFRSGHLLVLSIIILLVAGMSAVANLPRLEDPRIDTRNVLVITPYPGASAERVEALVTDVIEDELRQLFEIKELRSTTRAGISVIIVELQPWVDKTTNEGVFSKIRDRLRDASQHFPSGVGEPQLDDKRAASAFTLMVALQADEHQNLDPMILSRMSDELSDRIRNVHGTEIVRNYGDVQEEVSVTISAQQLSSAGLSVAQASRLVAANDPKTPAGVVRNEQQNMRIQVAEELDSLDTIRNIPLLTSSQGNYLRLGDIADVKRSWKNPPDEIAMYQGKEAVIIAARMQTNVRVDRWMANALAEVDAFAQQYQGTLKTNIVFDQNKYTEARLNDLTENLLMGSLVVMAVVMLFMGNRAAWIVGLALPLSAAFTIFSLSFYGQQIHQMSIFGIIIAIGLLIDNAIVITDEIRANLVHTNLTRLQALVKSIRHLFVPLLASTLTTVLGFMPIFLLPGNIGDFVGPIAISVVMALIGSLFISLTIIAALAARYLKRAPQSEMKNVRWYQQGIQMPAASNWFRAFLNRSIRKPLLALSVSVAIPIIGFVLAGQLGNVFFPSADRDQFEIYVWLPNGASIHQTRSVVEEIDKHLIAQDGVTERAWLVGASIPSFYYNQIMTRDNTPHYAQAVVTTDSILSAKNLIGSLQKELDESFTNAQIVVRAFGQGPPIYAPIGIDIYGTDLTVLNQLGNKVRLAMSQVPGLTHSTASVTIGEPELVMATTSDSTQLSDLTLTDIAQQLQSAVEGQVGGSILEGTEEVPVRIRIADTERNSIDALSTLPLINSHLGANQTWVPLSALGEFELRPTVSGISRINGVRVNKIEAFLMPGVSAVDAGNYLMEILAGPDFELPDGYYLKMKGDADKQKEAMGQLATYAPVLMVMMIATLILSFNSVRLAAVIGAVAVLSVGLGMLSLWISGLPVGFNPILGSVGLIGVAINGSIVVIAAINGNHLAKAGDIDEIVTETMNCSRHILSTTVTTVGGFIPLLLFSEGSFWPPLAVVLAGGVGFSVILSLVFTPVVVAMIVKRKAKRAEWKSKVPLQA
ncbi:efflux RND transporter permease subunit [Paraneptunicella aestuarii]|uniref:efflux RND transporter permease subunit n=1 Tax=Paraneptunicella aestuarii TaxID=2831148 RepID=UPI001E598F6F|nr:efflux RND transporter permease subunit [Paraneptunicella aestuarii]UAA38267.1 efflux RND transporter permease subunit [Paraneptunicella aestuarii]